ncbi:phage tail tube protein [Rhizobium rhizogenes]|uniref:phage tail tube protein n=1 Tax=Rhizobium rhizogenes TaxID=359 RepID=UPI0004D8EA92|nr:phage tail tube protein [Rhizobium rhizogenes]KEA07480.1 phage tail protein [Rhizobium rhizogenes]NTJ22248.1 phage tail protein [Rhizobium rhizogenes]QUE80966.1 phage tail protein [Rhizobium rhizogenes]TQO80929.1 phage tail protein [Rhizobium rhizogenes]TRB51523.1 phage tail protein [Rhizobium rhizogenes]
MADGEQLGRLLLIKVGDGADPEVFSNLCGLKDRSFDLSANSVDTTKPSCTNPGGPVQKTGRPGITSRTFQGSGVFVSSAAMKAFMTHVINATVFNAQVIVPGLGTFEGSYFVTSFTASGDMENDLQFSATFEAADVLDFTAEA